MARWLTVRNTAPVRAPVDPAPAPRLLEGTTTRSRRGAGGTPDMGGLRSPTGAGASAASARGAPSRNGRPLQQGLAGRPVEPPPVWVPRTVPAAPPPRLTA